MASRSSPPSSSNTGGVLSPASTTPLSTPIPTTTISHKCGGTYPLFGIYVGDIPLTVDYKLSTPPPITQVPLNFEMNAISLLQRPLFILSGVTSPP